MARPCRYGPKRTRFDRAGGPWFTRYPVGCGCLFLLLLVGPSGGAAGGEPPSSAPAERPAQAAAALPPPSGPASPSSDGPSRFTLHLDARLGLGGQGISNGYGDRVVGGASLPLGLSIGVNLTRALLVFGDLSDDHMLLFTSGDSGDATRFDLYGAGLGLKVHLTPLWFVSGSGALARLRLEHHAAGTEDSHWGPMGRLSTGLEWPLSSRWSAGIAAEYRFGVVHAPGPQPGEVDDPLQRRYALAGMSLVVLTSYCPGAAEAPQRGEVEYSASSPPAGYRSHDGLYLNASLGPGWLWATSHRQDPLGETPATDWSGRGSAVTLSAGFTLARRLVVFGAFSETQVRAPGGEAYLASLEWQGFGPGLRHYLMPANVFVGGAFLFSRLALYPDFSSRGFSHTITNWGGTGSLSLGKEWWVLGEVGVGVAAEFTYGKLPGTDGWDTFTARGISLLASATYN